MGKNFSVIKIPDNYQIEIGRNNTELNVPDVSISKKQGSIRFDMAINEFILEDKGSKYGTHILI